MYDVAVNIKSFLIGAASGALVFAAVNWILEAGRENGLTEAPSSAAKSTIAPIAGPPVAREDRPADSSLPMRSTDRVTASKRSEPRQFPTTETHDQPIADSDVPDRDSGLVADRRANLETEPKDEGWAYNLEQGILQFLTNHPAIAEFEISYIKCRTTVCYIKAIGYDKSTGPTWQRIIDDMREHFRGEFGQVGSGYTDSEGRLVIIANLHRLQPEN
jgi:hypothetical protein